jgi:hypothetical protein
MSPIESIQALASVAVMGFSAYSLVHNLFKSPQHPATFAAHASTIAFLFCASIISGPPRLDSLRSIFYFGTALTGLVSLVVEYRRCYRSKQDNQSSKPTAPSGLGSP